MRFSTLNHLSATTCIIVIVSCSKINPLFQKRGLFQKIFTMRSQTDKKSANFVGRVFSAAQPDRQAAAGERPPRPADRIAGGRPRRRRPVPPDRDRRSIPGLRPGPAGQTGRCRCGENRLPQTKGARPHAAHRHARTGRTPPAPERAGGEGDQQVSGNTQDGTGPS